MHSNVEICELEDGKLGEKFFFGRQEDGNGKLGERGVWETRE